MCAANTLPAEKKEELAESAVQMKGDISSCLASPPFLLVLHRVQDVQEAEKMDEGSFILTDSKGTENELLAAGYLQVASIEVLGLSLFRKVRLFTHSYLWTEILKF